MALLTDVLKKAKQNTTSQATPVKPTAIKPATPAPKPIVTDVNAETQMRPPAQPQPVALNSNVQKPQTEEEALAAGGGYNKSLAEFYKDKGLNFDTSKMSGSFDEEAQKFLDTQAEQKTELDKQVMDAKSKAARSLEENVAATKNQFAQSREGAMSAGNTLAGQNIVKNYQSGYQRDLDSINQKKKQLEDLQAQQQETFVAGRADSIRGMQKQIAEAEANLAKTQQENQKQTMDIIGMLNTSGALANMSPEDIQYMQEALPDAPPGVLQLFSSAATKKSLNEQRKTQFDNQISAINTMKGLVSEGINLTPDMMMSMSKQTGLPVESIMSFNQQALAISNDKSLDSLTKLANLKKVGNELDLEHRGIYTEEAKNIDYIKQLYQKGDIETAHLMERKLGVDDLSYQANLQLKQAQATIEQARSQGRALTPQDMSALADAQAKMADLNPGSYQGNTSLVATAHSYINTGGWKEAFKNNKVLQNGELGCAYVASDILKQAGLLDKNYNSIAQMVPALEAKGWTLHDTPSPGDVVVWGPMQGTDGHGHIGVVSGPNSAVNNQGPTGPADTPIFTGRPIVGFYAPPREKGLNGMSDSDILAAYEKAGKVPDAPSEARKLINTARQTGYLPSGKAENKPISDTQAQATGFALRATEAEDDLNKVLQKVLDKGAVGFTQESLSPNILRSAEFQQFDQAKRNFVSAVLRKESGAAISPAEYEGEAIKYFPQPGDSKEVIEQKKRARGQAINNLKFAAGPGWDQYQQQYGSQQTTPTTQQTAPKTLTPITVGKQTGYQFGGTDYTHDDI